MTPGSVHAFGDDAMGDLDAVAMAAQVRAGEVTAEALVAAAITRAEAVEPTLGAIVVDSFDDARARSRTVDAGPFAGVPTFIKDMLDVAGLPTRWGSPAFATAQPARATEQLAQDTFDMGMISLGKSTLPEMGFTPSTEFPDREPTRNPWNTDHSAGGSSGGAAALVAAGVVPIAHAADGGGSIRIPAACCGLVGLKPSRGRLRPTAYTAHQIVGITNDGVVSRSVRDTAHYLAMAEWQHRNRRLAPIGPVDRPIDRPLRIGAIASSPASDGIDAATQQAFDDAVALVESLGHRVEVSDLPVDEQFADDFRLYWAFNAFAVRTGGKLVINPSFVRDDLTMLTDGLSDLFRSHYRELPGAVARLRRSSRACAEAFASVDVALTPTLGHVPPALGHLGMDQPFEQLFDRMGQWACFTPYANATGAPAISLPLGHDEGTNLPVGTMFMADRGQEGLLLRLALQLEEAAPFRSLAGSPA